MAYIYIHTNKINGKRYVGITSMDDVKLRWQNGGGYRPNKGENNSPFYNAILKYGWNNFEHEAFECTVEYLSQMEEATIRVLCSDKSKYGYNATNGGEFGKLTDEAISKITGKGNGQSIEIEQYDLDGNYVASYWGCGEACRALGKNIVGRTNIHHVLNRVDGIAYGYQWKYKDSDKEILNINEIRREKEERKKPKPRGRRGRAIDVYDTNGNLIYQFDKAVDAANELCVNKESITSLCCHRCKYFSTIKGFTFEYL